ncbi:unnamed protein product [Ectocarpus fasciculatus]
MSMARLDWCHVCFRKHGIFQIKRMQQEFRGRVEGTYIQGHPYSTRASTVGTRKTAGGIRNTYRTACGRNLSSPRGTERPPRYFSTTYFSWPLFLSSHATLSTAPTIVPAPGTFSI